MAIDVYLQLDGIKGESSDSDHREWIECLSFDHRVIQPRSATASTSGGHTAGRCDVGDIVLSKLEDLSSPLLFQHTAMGKTIPKGKLQFYRADGNGTRVKYKEIELTNVLIGEYAPSTHSGDIGHESLALKFSKIVIRYTQQKIGGGTAGNTVGGWDLATNRPAS